MQPIYLVASSGSASYLMNQVTVGSLGQATQTKLLIYIVIGLSSLTSLSHYTAIT